jgi:hypothetical protein
MSHSDPSEATEVNGLQENPAVESKSTPVSIEGEAPETIAEVTPNQLPSLEQPISDLTHIESTITHDSLPDEEKLLTPEPSLGRLADVLNEESPLGVSLNFDRILVERNPSTLEILIENRTSQILQNVEILLESPRTLHSPLRVGSRKLAPGQSIRRRLEIEPSRPGNFVLQGSVMLDQGGEKQSFIANRALRVNAIPDASQVTVNIGDIQSNRGGGSNANLGAEYGEVNISNLVDGKTIRTLNDLLDLELPERFEPLELELDYQLSLASISVAREGLSRTLRIPPHLLPISQPGKSLRLTPTDGSDYSLTLVGRREFSLGKSRHESDFATWFWPRSPENDELTLRISKKHLVAKVNDLGELSIRDNGGQNGDSRYNDHFLSKGEAIAIDRRGVLTLATKYVIDLLHLPSRLPKEGPSISNLRLWHGPEPQKYPFSGAVRFNPTSCKQTPFQSIWLLSDGEFGTSQSNPIVLDAMGLAEIQGRFLYYRGCFWLENAVENSAVDLDGRPLLAADIAPLASGQLLRLGSGSYRVEILNS